MNRSQTSTVMKYSAVIHLVLLLLLATACRSALGYLEKGDLEKAIDRSLKQLERGKNPEDHKRNLSIAVAKQTERRNRVKHEYKTLGDIRSLERALLINSELRKLHSKVVRYLGEEHLAINARLQEEYQALELQIAEQHVSEGKRALDDYVWSGDKYRAQEAYYHFIGSQHYGMRGPEIDELRNKSFDAGQVEYVFELQSKNLPLENWNGLQRFKKLEQRRSEFVTVRVIDRPAPRLKADCHVILDFGGLNIHENTAVETVCYTRQIEVGHETTVDSVGREIRTPIYEEIAGTVETTTLTIEYRLGLRAEVYSATGQCEMKDASLRAYEEHEFESVRVHGDRRAIPAGAMCPSTSLDDEDDAIEDLIDELCGDVRRKYLKDLRRDVSWPVGRR